MRWMTRLRGGSRALGLAMLLALLVLRVWDPTPLTIVRERTFDLYQLFSPRQPAATPVIVVDLDERSLAEYGQWPWPRTIVADLLAALTNAGAVVVGFDIIFAEPDRLSPDQIADQAFGLDDATRDQLRTLPSNDDVLADVFRQTRVVVGRAALAEPGAQAGSGRATAPSVVQIGGDPTPHLPRFAGLLRNVPILEATAAGHGLLSVAPELDGIVRRMPAVAYIDGEIYPALALEVLRVARRESTITIRTDAAGIDSVVIGRARIPTDRNGRIRVHHAKRDKNRVISAADVLNRTTPADRIKGKLVLVGTSAVGLQDIKTTPLETGVPGVEIQAQILDMMLTQSYLTRPNFALGLEVVAALAVSLIVILLIPTVGAIWTLLIGSGIAIALAAGSWLAYATLGLLIDSTYPAAAAFLIYATLTYLSYVREESERRQVRSAFSQYMSPSLVAELAANPDRLRLGGETKEMTFLFCDVRGFTAISESYKGDPQGLTTLINDLLTPLSDAILAHLGTIDKYMGDCVMAFWNAPLNDPEHATNACRAALAMTAAIDLLNAKHRDLAAAAATPFVEVQVGIGINTGDCVVGNMGSAQRFDYSVLGDAVNLASRLEGQSKTYGVNVIVGPDTATCVDATLALLELDLIAVKGKQEAVRVFALIGDETVRHDADFQALHANQGALLAAYRRQDWAAACRLIDECGDNRWAPAKLYAMYAKRIDAYRQQPPGASWNGVFVAQEK